MYLSVKMRSRVSVHRIQRQTHVGSLLRNNNSHERFQLKSSLQLYNYTEYNASCCTSFWATVFEFCAIIESWSMWALCTEKNKNAAVSFKTNLLCLLFNKSIDMLKMHLSMENMILMYVGSFNIHRLWIMNSFLGSGHPQNAPENRKSCLPKFWGRTTRPPPWWGVVHDYAPPTNFITSPHW